MNRGQQGENCVFVFRCQVIASAAVQLVAVNDLLNYHIEKLLPACRMVVLSQIQKK